MEKIRCWFKNLSIRTTYFIFMAITTVCVSIASMLLMEYLKHVRHSIDTAFSDDTTYELKDDEILQQFYEDGYIYYYVVDSNTQEVRYSDYKNIDDRLKQFGFAFDQTGKAVQIISSEYTSGKYKFVSFALQTLYICITPILFVIGGVYTSIMFYRVKLRTPIQLLERASEEITKNNLNFSVQYNCQDEMGKLCGAFEKMRKAVYQSQIDAWENIESRKRLNSAFSHDLRTPLTVLKGYSELLMNENKSNKIQPEKLQSTLITMQKNIQRLEKYTVEMSRMQKLEDIQISKKSFPANQLKNNLYECASILCTKYKLQFLFNVEVETLSIDLDIVMQIFENIMTNAIRYAKQEITVECNIIGENLLISISDDGVGFGAEALKNATNPFYKEDHNVKNEHFGLGLYICSLLSQKHGGNIILSNIAPNGGKVTITINYAK